MAGKKRLRMRGVKQTPKRLEEEILSRARTIADDPSVLRPMCAGNCRKCAFDKTFKDINNITKYKRDEEALLKLASRGSDDIAKAYAGTISLAAAGKIPMLATATLAGEKVPFAVRGAVGNDKLIGCQYYNDPRIRLLLYNQFIKRNKLHLYSFEDGLVCSDRPNMPEDYLYETFWDTPYEFKDDGLQCGHESSAVLEIKIKSLNETISICSDCARDVSTVQYLIAKMCAVDPLDDLEVRIVHKFHSEGESGEVKIEGEKLREYVGGKLNDRTLIGSVKKEKLGNLKSSETSTYIVGTKNYGSDTESFLNALSGPEELRKTLGKFLDKHPRSIIIRNGKLSEAVTALWEEDWRELIAAHTSDKIASEYHERPRSSNEIVLEEAQRKFMSADVVASLPVFSRPKPVTRLADTLAKAAKVNGLEYVLKMLESEALKSPNERAVAAAFVLACDKNAKPPINLSASEKEFTQFLVPFAQAVIDARGEKYRDAMNTLLTASSSGESV
ncbi:MAG: hypothetical protein WCR17_05410 [Candidatus Methanomethylophilaceae archaeon]|jgi:hypothetical protein